MTRLDADNLRPSSIQFPLSDEELTRLRFEAGTGRVQRTTETIRLEVASPKGESVPSYCNAQLDDYHVDSRMRWKPPVRLTVRARFSHSAKHLRGTAGFGFWNDPVGMTGRVRLRMPQTAWFFFGSPPSDLKFARDVPGSGWKAATLDAVRPLSALLSPLAPLAFVALRWQWLYQKVWPVAERMWRIAEQPLPVDLRQWHDYEMVWTPQGLTWRVDGDDVFVTARAPKGPLGLIVWIDNQYMVARPDGRFAHGTLSVGPQWLELADLQVQAL
jgi:hypothetical protein